MVKSATGRHQASSPTSCSVFVGGSSGLVLTVAMSGATQVFRHEAKRGGVVGQQARFVPALQCIVYCCFGTHDVVAGVVRSFRSDRVHGGIAPHLNGLVRNRVVHSHCHIGALISAATQRHCGATRDKQSRTVCDISYSMPEAGAQWFSGQRLPTTVASKSVRSGRGSIVTPEFFGHTRLLTRREHMLAAHHTNSLLVLPIGTATRFNGFKKRQAQVPARFHSLSVLPIA